MPTDLMIQVRDYLDSISTPVDVSEIVDAPIDEVPRRAIRQPGPLVALATGAAIVAIWMIVVLLLRPAEMATPDDTIFADQITTVVTSEVVNGLGTTVGFNTEGNLCAVAGTTSDREYRCGEAAPTVVAFLTDEHLAVAGYAPASAVEVTLVHDGVHRKTLRLAPVADRDVVAFAHVSQIATSDADIEVVYPNGDVEQVTPIVGHPLKSLGFQATTVPLGSQFDSVWTGNELIVIDQLSRSAAYDPERGVWRELPPAPGTYILADPVWTGNEVLVCCHEFDGPAAAYDPVSDSWRAVAPHPGFIDPPTMVWTGSLAIGVTFDVVAGYDPARDEWVEYPLVPEGVWADSQKVGWTGTEVVVWPKGGISFSVSGGLALNPETHSWREFSVPESPTLPADVELAVTDDHL
ncbi:MAG: hypothetical protein PVG83_13405, partial [Acidimicrobiia bacterium]